MTDLARQLTVGYSSLASRVAQIRPPALDEIEVVLCVQGAGPDEGPVPPAGVDRVVHVPGVGVARSRNAAMDATTRRYLLFADDDVEICVDGVLAAVEHLRRTGKALALGRGVDPDGRLRKHYLTDRPTPLTLLNSAKAATYELLVDVEQVRRAGVRFDERFGAGVENYLGDEYLFVADALRAGLRGTALPHVFGVHPGVSSGSRWGGRDLHVRAVVLNHVFGPVAPVARLAFGLRRRRQIGGLRRLRQFVVNNARLPAHGTPAHPSPVVGTPPGRVPAVSATGAAESEPPVGAEA